MVFMCVCILSCTYILYVFFFFFQAEDGIRDGTVTGVQTCALPISRTQAADRVRRLAARLDLSRAGGPGARLPPRSLLRGAGGREGAGVRRAAPPRVAHVRSGSRGHGLGSRHRKDPGGRGSAVKYDGKDRRSGELSPLC